MMPPMKVDVNDDSMKMCVWMIIKRIRRIRRFLWATAN